MSKSAFYVGVIIEPQAKYITMKLFPAFVSICLISSSVAQPGEELVVDSETAAVKVDSVEVDTNGDIEHTELPAAVAECDCSDKVEAAIDAVQSTISDLTAKNSALSSSVAQKTVEAETLQTINTKLSEEIAALKQENQQCASDLEDLSRLHQTFQAEHSKGLSDARLRMAYLEAELATSTSKIQELSERSFVKQFQKEIMDLYNKFAHKK